MNKLNLIEGMGLKVTWKLLYIGLYGQDKIPIQLSIGDLFDYFDNKMNIYDSQTDDIIQLFCEKDDAGKIYEIISELANQESSEMILQLRKWRAYILQVILNTLNDDCLQAILQLMEFWVSMGLPEECPQEFPKQSGQLTVHNYFTTEMLRKLICDNTNWLEQEIKDINKVEQFLM